MAWSLSTALTTRCPRTFTNCANASPTEALQRLSDFASGETPAPELEQQLYNDPDIETLLSAESAPRLPNGDYAIPLPDWIRPQRPRPWEEPSEHWEDYLAAVSEHVEAKGEVAVDEMLRAISKRQASARPS